jgi:hypothetical protein
VKSLMGSASVLSKNTESTVHPSLARRLESELEDEAHSVALVSSSDGASVKLDETLDASSCQSHREIGHW